MYQLPATAPSLPSILPLLNAKPVLKKPQPRAKPAPPVSDSGLRRDNKGPVNVFPPGLSRIFSRQATLPASLNKIGSLEQLLSVLQPFVEREVGVVCLRYLPFEIGGKLLRIVELGGKMAARTCLVEFSLG